MIVGTKFLEFDTAEIARMLSPQVTLPSSLVDQCTSCLSRKPRTGLSVREVARFGERSWTS